MRREAEWVAKATGTNAITIATRDNVPGGKHVLTRIDASFSGSSTKLLQVYEAQDDSVVIDGNLGIHTTPEEFKTGQAAYYTIAGTTYTKAATTALTFTDAHVVTASKFGVILVQIDATGTVSTKVPADPQAYASAAAALAALPAADAGNVALGYIAIANNAGDWTANTDDLTDGSDLTTASFVDATETGTLRYEDYVVNVLAVEIPSGVRALENNRTIVAILPASGTVGMVGKVNLTGYTR